MWNRAKSNLHHHAQFNSECLIPKWLHYAYLKPFLVKPYGYLIFNPLYNSVRNYVQQSEIRKSEYIKLHSHLPKFNKEILVCLKKYFMPKSFQSWDGTINVVILTICCKIPITQV